MMKFEDGRLKQPPVVYLSGGMEYSKDEGVGWRNDITPHLKSLGYRVFNPVIEQVRGLGYSVASVKDLKTGDFLEFREIASRIVDSDLYEVSNSELVVCKIDDSVLKGAGTIGELTLCRYKSIPVIAWVTVDGGPSSLPTWLLGCLSRITVHEKEFYSIIPPAKHLKIMKDREKEEKVDQSINLMDA